MGLEGAQIGFVEFDKDAVTHGTTGFVCNMTGGSWESLPYPIVVDSGASTSVMPEKWSGVRLAVRSSKTMRIKYRAKTSCATRVLKGKNIVEGRSLITDEPTCQNEQWRRGPRGERANGERAAVDTLQ